MATNELSSGWSLTRTYRIWHGMKDRCLNKNNARFNRYGGRGITVCERWMDYRNFLADMGERPDGMSIDRIDNTKGYSPENCRWATTKQQSRNKSNNRIITHNGVTMTLADWSEHTGVKYQIIIERLIAGWDFADAINTNLKFNPKRTLMRSTNVTGCAGVDIHKASGKYQARIETKGKTKYLGLFENLDDAIAARKQAEQEKRNAMQR